MIVPILENQPRTRHPSYNLYKWRIDYEEFGNGSFPGKGTLRQKLEQKIISELEAKLKKTELESDTLKISGHFPRAVGDI